MTEVQIPLTVAPLPADAEAQQLERELAEHLRVTETFLASVRAARLTFRAAEAARPPDVSALPATLGRGAPGVNWREGQLPSAQEELRASCLPARGFLLTVQQALRESREPTLARMRALDLVHAVVCPGPEDVAVAVRRLLDDFEAAFPAFGGRLDFDATTAALAAAQVRAGRPRKGELRVAKWVALAQWVAPLGTVGEAGLQKEYQRWRRGSVVSRARLPSGPPAALVGPELDGSARLVDPHDT